MDTVSNESLAIAFTNFCEVMGLDDDKMSSAFGFTICTDFSIMNVMKEAVRTGKGDIATKPGVVRVVNNMIGPHSTTFIRAWKHHRYSPYGKVRAFFLKPAHILAFFIACGVAFAIESWR